MLHLIWQTRFVNFELLVLIALALFAVIAIILFIGGRAVPSYKLYVRTFSSSDESISQEVCVEFANLLLNEWLRITRAHSYETLVDQGEENLANVKWYNEDMELVVREISEDHLENHPFFSKFLLIIDRIWPRYVIMGDLSKIDDNKQVEAVCTLYYSSKRLASWTEPDKEWQSSEVSQVAHRLAYRVIFDILRNPDLFDGVLVGTVNREAFYFHSLGLEKWHQYRSDNSALFDEIDGLFSSSLEHDPLYALAHYNRGVLYYELGRGETSNKQALAYFKKAIEVADQIFENDFALRNHIRSCLVSANDIGDDETTIDQIIVGLKQSTRRVKGLSLIGISRCHSQEVHRYGEDVSISQLAREAAAAADEILGPTPVVLYAKAFAWHCTESLSDIRVGADFYRQIINEHPNRYATVHLNLGYILMVGAEQLDAIGGDALEEARQWYAEAEKHSKIASEIAPEGTRIKKYALANLGNISRLRGAYTEARNSYQQAVDADAEYINGIAEYAWVFIEERNFADAVYWHKRALETASQNSGNAHVVKIRKEFSRKLFEVGHLSRVEAEKLVKLSELIEPDATDEWLGVLGQTSLQDW